VSVVAGGGEAKGTSYSPALSGDGRSVAFQSGAMNLQAGEATAYSPLYVYDRESGKTTCITLGTDGKPGNGAHFRASLSHEGRFVAFRSYASNLVRGDSNQRLDIFVHNRESKETRRVTTDLDDECGDPQISPDGGTVVFWSKASNLVPGDTNKVSDVFMTDLEEGKIVRVSVGTGGAQSNAASWDCAISGP